MSVGTILLSLHECLCAKIAEKVAAMPEYKDVCACSVFWSEMTMLDYCGLEIECNSDGCGHAWVRFAGVAPDPSVDTVTMKCAAAFEVTFEVGIGRCSATGDPMDETHFRTPQPDDYLADVLVGLEDMEVIQQAVMCCGSGHKNDRLSITNMVPFGPEGGCFGTMATVTMQLLI